MIGARFRWPDGIATFGANRHTDGNDFALLDTLDTAQDLGGCQEIERTYRDRMLDA